MKYWKIVFGFFYTLLYGVSAFIAIGFGKGTGIFLSPLIAFLGLSWIALLIALYLSTNSTTTKAKFFFIALMVGHYLMSLVWLMISWEGNIRGTIYVWDNQRSVIWLNLGVYFLGQAIIWLAFF